MAQAKDVSVLLSTCPPGDAERLAFSLVESRLAACVNILPAVTSVYRWEGEIERSAESLLVIKCPADKVEEVVGALIERHPYDVPEVLALAVEKGHPPYLDWVLEAAGP